MDRRSRGWIGATVVLGTFLCLGACGTEAQQGAEVRGTPGDVANSTVVLHSQTEGASEVTSQELEIESIACDTDQDRTEVHLEDGGRVSVEVDGRPTQPAWLLVVDLEELDILGGYRETVFAEHSPLEREADGTVTGGHPFRLYGDLAGQYAIELAIRC